ncbi:MAG: hypothetical protein JO059_11160 [Mycobacterium sp.]|nr:hypothetical protein [Mycobacterium sp.]
MNTPAPEVAAAVAPAGAPPAEDRPSTTKSAAPVGEPAREAGVPAQQDGAPAEQQPNSNARQPYLTRMLEHIPGDTGEPGQ